MMLVASTATVEPTRLMLEHAHALLGTFITSVTMVEPGWWQIRSVSFPDEIDWNLDILEPTVIQASVPASSALWTATTSDNRRSSRRGRRRGQRRAQVIGTEHWLMRDLITHPPVRARSGIGGQVRISLSDRATASFCDVFRDAFELTPDENRSYRTAFLCSQPPADVHTSYVVVALEGEPAAVASLHRTPSTSFLYNAGTRPEHRGHGCATRAVTELLCANAAGSDSVWLQCVPDSREEDLYHRLGFETMFEASIIAML